MKVYYNEFDAKTAAWLRQLIADGLIPAGDVDERSICDVQADDVRGYDQCHFFAGIGGWAYALQLAGWGDRPVWTGSCPCQPFSSAGKRKGHADERHLWPEFYRLIRECRPERVFGEQVESAVGHGWLDGVFADLEAEGYACGAVVLGAHSVGAPHIRQRLWWVAHASLPRHENYESTGDDRARVVGAATMGLSRKLGRSGPTRRLADAERDGREMAVQPAIGGAAPSGIGEAGRPGMCSAPGRLGVPIGERLEGHAGHGCDGCEPGRLDADAAGSASEAGWAGEWIACADGKARRIKPGLAPLAHGIPARVVRLRGYGNAIVPQVAAEFIRAYIESTEAACL